MKLRARRDGMPRGFTLVEAVLALALLVIVMLLLNQLLTSSGRSVDATQRRAALAASARSLLAHLRQDLQGAFRMRVATGVPADDPAAVFKAAPANPEGAGRVVLFYVATTPPPRGERALAVHPVIYEFDADACVVSRYFQGVFQTFDNVASMEIEPYRLAFPGAGKGAYARDFVRIALGLTSVNPGSASRRVITRFLTTSVAVRHTVTHDRSPHWVGDDLAREYRYEQ